MRHQVTSKGAQRRGTVVVTRSRDGKQFTPEELAKEVLAYLRGEGKGN